MFWHNKRAFLTGIQGFTGQPLSQQLRQAGAQVFGLEQPPQQNVSPGIFSGDVRDQDTLCSIFSHVQPEFIFHLAGVLKSETPQDFYDTHITGTVALFEALRKSGITPTVVVISSSAVYGQTSEHTPIRENHSLSPRTHYGISKMAQEQVAEYYFREHQIPIIICRPFNLSGPGLSPNMALSAFTRQIACAEKNGRGGLQVGALNAYRDFLDVRDAVAGYIALAQYGTPGNTYNVCSGTSVSLRVCLDTLVQASQVNIPVQVDPSRMQRADVDFQVGDNARLRETTGWQLEIPLEQSLMDLLDD